MPVIRRRAPLLALATVVVASSLLVYRFGSRHVSMQGIQFDVPYGWAVNAGPWPSMTSTGLAIVGTLPWGNCAASDLNCHYLERLSRNEIEVDISFGGLRSMDFCEFARERPDLERSGGSLRIRETHYLRIDGRPAISIDYANDSDGWHEADGMKEWLIAGVDSTTDEYRISARWRGPADAEMLAALDRLIATIRLESLYGATAASGPDCGDPFPPAA